MTLGPVAEENTEYFSQEPEPPILKFSAEVPGQVDQHWGPSRNPMVLLSPDR